jgi:PAS domain S-box-containing protein
MGTLSFGTRSRTTFSADDLAMMKAVADQVAVAMSRVSAGAALRESEERYRELVQSSPDAVIVHRDGKFLYANLVALRLHGAESMEQLQTKTVLDFIHPEDRAVVAGFMERRKAGQKLPLEETRMVRLDGQVIPVEATGGLVNYDGKPATQVVIRNIADRRQAEAALRRSEAQARQQLEEIQSIYDSAPIGLCVFDRSLRYVRINRRLAEINGIPASDHIGRTVREILPDVAPFAEELTDRIIRTGEPVLNVEFSGTTLSQPGIRRTLLENWLPLKNADGTIFGINVVVEEFTERKRT